MLDSTWKLRLDVSDIIIWYIYLEYKVDDTFKMMNVWP